MPNAGYGEKGMVLADSAFQHLIDSSRAIKPREAAFHFPPLPTVLLFASFSVSQNARFAAVITDWNTGHNVAFAQGQSERIGIVAFVPAATFWPPDSSVHRTPVNQSNQFALVVSFGSRYPHCQRVAAAVNQQMPFDPSNSVFTGEIDGKFATAPVFDNTPVAIGISQIYQFFLTPFAFNRSNIFLSRPEYLSCLSVLLATEYEHPKS